MNLSCKLFVATFAIGAVGTAAFAPPLAAAPITLLDGLRKAPAVDVQTVQNAGERSNTGTQLGPDYGNVGPRSSGSSGTRDLGEPPNTGNQPPLGR
jgi:hypothetical protein